MAISQLAHFDNGGIGSGTTVSLAGVSFASACTIVAVFTAAGNGGGPPQLSAVTDSSGLTWTQQQATLFNPNSAAVVEIWTAQTLGPVSGITITATAVHGTQNAMLSVDGFLGLSRPLVAAVTNAANHATGAASNPTVTDSAITATTSLEIGATVAGGSTTAPTFTASGWTQAYAPLAHTIGQSTEGYKINSAAVPSPSYTSGPAYLDWSAVHIAFTSGADPVTAERQPVIAFMG